MERSPSRMRTAARYFSTYFLIGEVAGLAGNHLHFSDNNVMLKSLGAGVVGAFVMDRVNQHGKADQE
jgi:hypothetical protein